MTSHEMDDVERLADHVGFLADGRLLVEEPMSALLARMAQSGTRFPQQGTRRGSMPGLATYLAARDRRSKCEASP